MKIDILHTLANLEQDRSWSGLLQETRDRAVLADELGFDGIWLGEHHFDAYGTDQCPNPVMLAADLAGRTERIRLGMAAVTLPLWHPVRLAEDLAMLDHFCAGRLDVAFSRGILPGEIVNINPEADRRNDGASRAIFAENLEVVRRAWTQEEFSWEGERYRFPQPDMKWPGEAFKRHHGAGGTLTSLPIIPQPLQRPTPPLFSVTESLEGFLSAARDGLSVITWYPSGAKLDGLIAAYAAERASAGRPPLPGSGCSLLRPCWVAATDEEARAQVEPYVREAFRFIKQVRGIGVWLREDEDPEDPRWDEIDPFDLLMERDHLLVGSPETVAERMVRMSRDHGVEHWLLSFYSEMDPAQTDAAMKLLAEEVAPAVRRATGTVAA